MTSFPVFIEVGGRPPLVVGGGGLAAIKVRTLLLRAPRVTVIAETVGPEIGLMVAEGRVDHVAAEASIVHIKGRPLVISATGDFNEDARVSAIAHALGVPVNVPDRPELCSCSLPSIVDRGAVTVAIGTAGAAPVLATRLRQQIEQELHPRLGRLAEIARDYRAEVAQSLPAGAARRAFWNDVFSGAAADAILGGDEVAGRAHIEQRLAGASTDAPQLGHVLLVGAGPGDPELLTLKAVRALKSADVVLHDGLMGTGVLAYARREARIICVAKAKGRHSKTQAEINALIVAFAREGKTVVRLKGGDPSIFGRGGEEVDILRASGIPVEVVPGITAATAVAASLQIPLTHRDISRSVTFISGHACGDGAPDFDQVDFAALSRGRATLAVYMGLATAHVLARTLIESGWSPATPVIAVSRVSQPGERRIGTTLDVMAAPAFQEAQGPSLGGNQKLSGPTLLLIGELASLDAAGMVEHVAQTPLQRRPLCTFEREPAHA